APLAEEGSDLARRVVVVQMPRVIRAADSAGIALGLTQSIDVFPVDAVATPPVGLVARLSVAGQTPAAEPGRPPGVTGELRFGHCFAAGRAPAEALGHPGQVADLPPQSSPGPAIPLAIPASVAGLAVERQSVGTCLVCSE